MLKELSIRNFAIIDDLQIRFSEGLTILSGETGAGKSIILNAVNLLLGSRASADLVRTGAQNAELEALFQITGSSRVANIMAEHGYEPSDGLLVRRIISRSDMNRVYINGRMATIQLLNAITENLASISGQHVHQLLLKEEQHLLILDQFGGLMPLREEVSAYFHQMLPFLEKLKELNTIKERQVEQIELLEFQLKEITAANPARGEGKALEQERVRLKNAEELYQVVYNSIESLYSAPGSVIEKLVDVKKNLDKISQIDPQLKSKTAKLSDTTYQIEDLIEGLRSYLNSIQMDEKQIDAVEERLDTLNKLKRKYGGSIEAVFDKLKSIEQDLANVENIADSIRDTETQISELHSKLKDRALILSRKRKKTADRFAKKVIDQLATLMMSKTEFKASLQVMAADGKTNQYLTANSHIITETGIDRATFLIAPNIGEALKPLASIASGGELSRVVLALKALLVKTDSVETVVFDEVDAGIGGGVAEVVGKKLADLAAHHQVICITHLPQIAKFGDQHYSISKHVTKGRTRTSISLLSDKDRYKEIARMLGGEKITQATLEHAREMLER
ncbi:MAG: DNA repair protein RecN [Desulfobacterales bacterium]|nr:DNA repair protein RecN [Desulfobacterales bacterium]